MYLEEILISFVKTKWSVTSKPEWAIEFNTNPDSTWIGSASVPKPL